MRIIKTKKVGDMGESVAAYYLLKQGYIPVLRNYRKKCGEIDIIADYKGVLHFIEVKTVRRGSGYNPAQNMHAAKLRRMLKTAQLYLMETKQEHKEYAFDVVCVSIDVHTNTAHVKFIENIVE